MRIRRPLYNMFYAAMICAAVLLVIPRVASAQVELLQNPGFEGVYNSFNNDNTRLLAPGWTPWNLTASPGEPSHVNNQPTYRSSTARVHSGSVSQEFFTFFATHTAGVYQKVAVANGTKLQFSVWLNVWSTANDDPDRSELPGQVKLQVGIDPAGGTDATAAGIIWTDPVEFYDQWRELSVTATATGDAGVTVFVRSAPALPAHHNHVYVDDASLHLASDTTATPTALPPSATATPPAVVTATPPEIPSPTREGTIQPTEGVTVAPPSATATLIPPTVILPTLTQTPIPPSATPSAVPPTVGATLPPSLTPSKVPTNVPFTPTPVVTGTPFSSEFPYTIKYTVQYGNTLSDIAVMLNSDVDAIVKANGIEDAGLIYVGQVLDIPTRTPPPPTPAPIPPTAPYPPNLNGPTNGGIGTYIVQPGDDLSKIAGLYRTTPWALAKLNGILNPNLIKIGQVLVVPGPGNNGGPGGGVPPPPPPPQRTHVIRFGETLYSISIRYGVPLEALMQINGIINPSLIYVGQVLRIP